jgi:histidyl-tRNA synthetase
LVGIFGVEAVPGVGFGMGDVTIRDFLETYKLLPEFVPTTELVICAMHEGLFPQAETLAAELRKNGLKVALDFTTRKIGKQIAAAEKQGVPFVLCVGDNEAKSGRYELKHMKTRKTFSVGPEEILVTIRGLNGVHQTSTSGR